MNVELFINLRNKIEHRYEPELKSMTGGKAQALVVNYDAELTAAFGGKFSLADKLRFPVFLHALRPDGAEQLRAATANLPRPTRDLVSRFETGIEQDLLDDLRYDFRIRLVPITGPKTSADLAVNFVKLDELSDEERRVMVDAGRTGTVIVRDRHVDVVSKDKLLPGRVAQLVDSALPFEFSVNAHTKVWQHLRVRPPCGSLKPHETDARYCLYDEPFGLYPA
nr:DUF3644 domain-containing protein [Amycolatopsis sp. CA-230715]